MARPREFDIDQALDSAIELFWRRGYAATSMSDLMKAMGLQKGSIYKAWRDKQDLFLQALGQYQERALHGLRDQFESAVTPRDAIEKWLQGVATRCQSAGGKKGCLAVNSMVELAPHDDSVARLSREHCRRIERVIASEIESGQQLGQFDQARPAAELAKFLVVFVHGLHVCARESLSPKDARSSVRLALDALAPPC